MRNRYPTYDFKPKRQGVSTKAIFGLGLVIVLVIASSFAYSAYGRLCEGYQAIYSQDDLWNEDTFDPAKSPILMVTSGYEGEGRQGPAHFTSFGILERPDDWIYQSIPPLPVDMGEGDFTSLLQAPVNQANFQQIQSSLSQWSGQPLASYVWLNLAEIRGLIEALGGLQVTLSQEVATPEEVFPAQQDLYLSGRQVEKLTNKQPQESVIAYTDRIQNISLALYQALFDLDRLEELDALFLAAEPALTSNLPFNQLVQVYVYCHLDKSSHWALDRIPVYSDGARDYIKIEDF